MRIAIPVANEQLSPHFGHCEKFALIDVDTTDRKILSRVDIEAPPHEPGLLPIWLAERGADLIITGGVGRRAQGLFAEQGIRVVIGAPVAVPEVLIDSYLAGELSLGANLCDH
ncbi:MAG: NifB/NifX family molybdenum-iron cluster-binding protein [Acidobacteriota bacterium]|jgi:ATP-binding protein involved in chromosome partitioning